MEFGEIELEDLSVFQSRLQKAVNHDGHETTKEVLEDFLKPNGCFKHDFDEQPAVCVCAKRNNIELMTLLFKLGLDLEQCDRYGVNPLQLAAKAGHERVAEFLLNEGANVDQAAENWSEWTPLHYAANFEQERIVGILLNKGANVNQRASYDLTPLHLASFNSCLEIVKLLVEAGAMLDCRDVRGFTPLLHSCDISNWKMASFLVEKGADVNVRHPYGNTPLMFVSSAKEVNVRLLSDLLTVNASVHSRDDSGETPLHAVVLRNTYDRRGFRLEAIEMLLTNGCDINARTNFGHTPLHVAIMLEDETAARVLIRAGCSVDIKDELGATPVSYAIRYNYHHLTELLLAAGASMSLCEWMELQEVLWMRDPSMLERIRAMKTEVPKLTNFCRRAFLKRYGIEFGNRIDDLFLPTSLKRFLAFETLQVEY